MLGPARSSLRKAGASNQTVYWQGQKQGGVCCAQEMAEKIITTKETLPPIHSPTSYSPSSLPISNHTPGYLLFFSPVASLLVGLYNMLEDHEKPLVMPWGQSCLSSPLHTAWGHPWPLATTLRKSVKANTDWLKPESSNRLPALHFISASQSSKLKLAYR